MTAITRRKQAALAMSTLQDANATTVAANGPPPGHANAHISRRNDMESPFLRLPLEIRLDIYELAVKENEVIRPRQVTKGSNLFVWGQAKYARHHPGLQEYSWVQTGGGQLTVTALLATCKAIYDELRERPVFYRINTFEFSSPREIHDFLAALTPARRNAIREIACVFHHIGPAWYGWDQLSPRNFDGVLPILAHCRDLRSFRVVSNHAGTYQGIAPIPNTYLDNMGDQAVEKFRRMARRVAEDNGHDADIWSLPSLRAEYNFAGPFWQPFMQELMNAEAPFQQALARRQRAANRTDLKAIFTPEDVQRAVQKARVDLVGEIRLTRDRGEVDDAPIARRTRGQEKAKQTFNKYGTLKSPIAPKYDLNGHLQWTFARIKEVRWSSHTIECQVAYFSDGCDPEGQAWPSSYEPVHVLGTEYALERLRVYYQSFCMLPAFTIDALEERIDQMQAMPSPKDCALEHPEMMTHKSRRSMWKAMQNSWVNTISRLQEHIRYLERRDGPRLGREGEEARPAGQGGKREAETTIFCATHPNKKART